MIKFYILIFVKTGISMALGFVAGWLLAMLPKSRKRKRVELPDDGQ